MKFETIQKLALARAREKGELTLRGVPPRSIDRYAIEIMLEHIDTLEARLATLENRSIGLAIPGEVLECEGLPPPIPLGVSPTLDDLVTRLDKIEGWLADASCGKTRTEFKL